MTDKLRVDVAALMNLDISVRTEAARLFLMGHTMRAISKELKVSFSVLSGWSQQHNWYELRKNVLRAIEERALADVKVSATRAINADLKMYRMLQKFAKNALMGKNIDGKQSGIGPLRLTNAKDASDLLLRAIEGERSLVMAVLDATSEALPQFDPKILKLSRSDTPPMSDGPGRPAGGGGPDDDDDDERDEDDDSEDSSVAPVSLFPSVRKPPEPTILTTPSGLVDNSSGPESPDEDEE